MIDFYTHSAVIITFQKNYAVCNIQLRIFFDKQLCAFFTPADLSHYSMQNIKIQFCKRWIVY